MSTFLSIIPFDHSIGISPLIYASGDIDITDISIGSIVEIPYGKNTENGIITEIHETCPIEDGSEAYTRIKRISSIVTINPILAPYQIDMIYGIARHYMITIHRVLAIFLPKPVLRRLEKKQYEQLEKRKILPKKGIKNIHIIQDGVVSPELIENYTRKGSTIVILPDEYAMMPYRLYLKGREDILFVSSEMTDIRRSQAWINISNMKFPIIYGTRKIIYYNLSAYDHIIYVEDALGPDYWHYPVRMRYSDILGIFAASYPTVSLSIITSIPTLGVLSQFRDYTINNISSLDLSLGSKI